MHILREMQTCNRRDFQMEKMGQRVFRAEWQPCRIISHFYFTQELIQDTFKLSVLFTVHTTVSFIASFCFLLYQTDYPLEHSFQNRELWICHLVKFQWIYSLLSKIIIVRTLLKGCKSYNVHS